MRYLIILFSLFINLNLLAQQLEIDNSGFFYQIAPLFEFKKSVVSLTFDDGTNNQFLIGMPLLIEKSLPATFYLITDRIDAETDALIAKNSSPYFEFGSHTLTHPDLVKIGIDSDKIELLSSSSFLKDNFGNSAGLTLSYPWGIYNNSIKKITSEIYLAARSTDPGYNSFHNIDRYALKAKSFEKNTDLKSANEWVNYTIRNNLWLVEMIHGINGIGYSPIDSSTISEHLDYINSRQDDIWCGSVGNVIKYLDESKTAAAECVFCNDSVYNIRVDDFRDDFVFDQPLTVRIKIPSFWNDLEVSDIEKFTVEINNDSKYIIFNTLPDNKLHSVKPKSLLTPQKESGIKIIYLSENPFADFIELSIQIFKMSSLEFLLYDLNGRVISRKVKNSANGIINLHFETSNLNSGLYLLMVRSNFGDIILRKMVKSQL